MGAVDPKDMTASEILRDCARRSTRPELAAAEYYFTETYVDDYTCDLCGLFRAISDKIDAELAEARADALNASLRSGAELWAKANGWPDFREGDDFGAWLDRCAFPKPMDEHGEPVQLGEHIDDKVRGDIDVSRISYTANGHYFNNSHNSAGTRIAKRITYAPGERVKRPAPEVLGADGLPIKDGETVWLDEAHSRCAGSCGFEDGNEYSLCGIERQEMLTVEDAHIEVDGREYVRVCTCGALCHASWLTHTPPDTQQRIDDDASLPPREYYNAHIGHDVGLKDDEEVVVAMVHDLLRRQRRVIARGGDQR